MIKKCLLRAGMALSLSASALVVSFAPGQYNPYYPRAGFYNPYYVNTRSLGPGYYMQGAASVIGATGSLYVQQEQARVEREKANQAKLDTKRKAFDEMMYEKANTPTYTEEADYKKGVLTQRLMTNPQPAEITRGDTLNAMLPLINQLMLKGAQGPPITIDPTQLAHVNISGAGPNSGSLGMLKNGGTQFEWPLVVQGPKQEKLAALLPQAVLQTSMGKLTPKLYQDLTKALTDVQEELRTKFHKEQIDGGSYLTGKRFLDSLEQSVKSLQQPGARNALGANNAALGGNVPELVYNMTSKGLTFAPANPGDESAYFGLHNSFVAYTSSAQASSGFQVRYNPPRTDQFVNK